jgi:ribosomal protein S18 acetylase RimI-like enzyme
LDSREIQIVEVVLKDLAVLQEISKRTFYDSFAALNTAENMQFHLDNYFTEEKLTSEILNRNSKFFFAIYAGMPVGYLKLNLGDAQTVLPNDQAVEIERIYIDQKFKGLGIGNAFILKATAYAYEAQAKYIWLGVWEHNESAIRFYDKNGFEKFSKHIFKLGDDEQTDLLMKKLLNN